MATAAREDLQTARRARSGASGCRSAGAEALPPASVAKVIAVVVAGADGDVLAGWFAGYLDTTAGFDQGEGHAGALPGSSQSRSSMAAPAKLILVGRNIIRST